MARRIQVRTEDVLHRPWRAGGDERAERADSREAGLGGAHAPASRSRYTRMMRLAICVGVGMGLAAGCSSDKGGNTPPTDTIRPAAAVATQTAPSDRKYLLERVDDAAVVQLYADG